MTLEHEWVNLGWIIDRFEGLNALDIYRVVKVLW